MSSDIFEWEGRHGTTRLFRVSVALSLAGKPSIFLVADEPVREGAAHAAGYMPLDVAVDMAHAILEAAESWAPETRGA